VSAGVGASHTAMGNARRRRRRYGNRVGTETASVRAAMSGGGEVWTALGGEKEASGRGRRWWRRMAGRGVQPDGGQARTFRRLPTAPIESTQIRMLRNENELKLYDKSFHLLGRHGNRAQPVDHGRNQQDLCATRPLCAHKINQTHLSILAEHVTDVFRGVSSVKVADKQRLQIQCSSNYIKNIK
jgi:hypothetical protein